MGISFKPKKKEFYCVKRFPMKIKSVTIFLLVQHLIFNLKAQQGLVPDTLRLNPVDITPNKDISEIERLGNHQDLVIYAGKKNEVIRMDRMNADLSINNSRQVFAKVPGMSVWENDGSGIQVGVAARGLSPNRSWEFNVRQNGYDISAEPFGYPEAYYSPPMEALEKIEVVRGSASLQFGPQFGGVLNYKIKKANPLKKLEIESVQTIGSYGLFCSYNSMGGTIGKFSYFGFLHRRSASGWRENSSYNTFTGYLNLSYQVHKKIKISAEYTGNDYRSQQAGGLTDQQFTEDHRQSVRQRNWFSAPWNIAAVQLDWKINSSLEIKMKSFATIAERNSVGYLKAINILDSINPATGQYNTRQVDRDFYKNAGTEVRAMWKYKIKNKLQILATGIRAYNGKTNRNQLGIGSTGKDFDLRLYNGDYGRSLNFSTLNCAIFAEQIFQLTERLKIVPGIRQEIIENTSEGYINTSGNGKIEHAKRTRSVFLYGAGMEFSTSKKTGIYANYSRAFRPVTFSELTPSATTDVIDPNMKDASGFNADLGFRGSIKNYLSFDVSAFYLMYDNRIGTLTRNGSVFRTNIGTSVNKGIESYMEISPVKIFTDSSKFGEVLLFSSNAWIDAQYVKWNNPEIANEPSKSINGKQVENAPRYIHRLGITYKTKKFSATFQLNSVGEIYTDAINTETPNSAATVGKLPGYEVMDASFSWKIGKRFSVKGGVNNLNDVKYATRRSGGYPGPGILPGNGRTGYFSFGINF